FHVTGVQTCALPIYIPPGVYGEENTLSVITDPQRHYFETTFLFQLLGGFWNEDFKPFLNEKPKYMVTGFCLGMQTMNVATGGTRSEERRVGKECRSW